MTFPTEFENNSLVVGDSAIKHPIYTFTVQLDRLKNEAVGPNTNQRSVNLLHPDMSNQSPDYGRTLLSNHDAVAKASWLPGFLRQNVVINDNGTITAYGQNAVYLKKTYADIANPLLVLTNSAPYTAP